ncbi:hypothetical protein WJ74_17930 [Burkholderia ubonensis]|nr:hypothetical protein WJ74_17930 [Burkholderia ubonensis]
MVANRVLVLVPVFDERVGQIDVSEFPVMHLHRHNARPAAVATRTPPGLLGIDAANLETRRDRSRGVQVILLWRVIRWIGAHQLGNRHRIVVDFMGWHFEVGVVDERIGFYFLQQCLGLRRR